MVDTQKLDAIDQEQLEKHRALGDPLRLRLFRQFQKTRTVSEAAEELGIDRTLLYYHVRILLKAGLIEEVETRKAGHVTESVYATKNLILDHKPGSERLTRDAISMMQETVDDFRKSRSQPGRTKTGTGRHIIKIKSENFLEQQQLIDDLAIEVLERLDAIEDKDGDRSYSFTLLHFEL